MEKLGSNKDITFSVLRVMFKDFQPLLEVTLCIENQLHWILDVGFAEDAAQSCSRYNAENLAVIRHVAINLLSRDTESKVGVKTRRLQAGWDDNYLKTVLSYLNVVTS